MARLHQGFPLAAILGQIGKRVSEAWQAAGPFAVAATPEQRIMTI
jgi:hypothetical protein